jgi:orotate phosphoribosyltransferase
VCGPLNEGALVALMVAADLECEFTYAERFANPDRGALFPIDYRLPAAQHPLVRGRRVAIVNDVISAGSAVRGTLADLEACGAVVVVVTALLLLGSAFAEFAQGRGIPLEVLSQTNGNVWPPEDCPLCRSGVPLENHVR